MLNFVVKQLPDFTVQWTMMMVGTKGHTLTMFIRGGG